MKMALKNVHLLCFGIVLVVISIFAGCIAETTEESGTKCFRDESLGDRVGNTYYCSDPDLPECCQEEESFTCCEDTSKKTLKEQLVLWGCVCGVGLLIAFACCYFWKDSCCGKDETPLNCCCCRNKPPEDKKALTPEPEAGSSRHKNFSSSPWQPSSHFSGATENWSNRGTPPPFNYKSPSSRKY